MKYKRADIQPAVVFLDTNVIIEMANGIHSGDSAHRGKKVFDALKKAVRSGKIICPFVHQRDEYARYVHDEVKKELDDILLSLGRGHQVTVRKNIEDAQIQRMAVGYLKEGTRFQEFELQKQDIFDPDSHKEPSEAENALGIKIVVLHSGHIDEDRDVTEPNLLTALINRRAEVRRFELSKEQVYKEESSAVLDDLKKSEKERVESYNKINPNANILHHASLNLTKKWFLENWHAALRTVGLSDPEYKKCAEFIHSEHFLLTPHNVVGTALYTEIIMSERKIEITDPRDVDALSLVLPYSEFVLADSAMRAYIHQSGLNEMFNVHVYALDSWERFLGRLESTYF